jgi:hypothetical protein
MKRIRVEERPGITLFTFTIGDRALSRGAANRSNGLLKPAHQKRQEDTTDEFSLGRNSCLVLNFSTCVPSVTNIVQQNLIQEQTASLTASSTTLISILLGAAAEAVGELLVSEADGLRPAPNRGGAPSGGRVGAGSVPTVPCEVEQEMPQEKRIKKRR